MSDKLEYATFKKVLLYLLRLERRNQLYINVIESCRIQFNIDRWRFDLKFQPNTDIFYDDEEEEAYTQKTLKQTVEYLIKKY